MSRVSINIKIYPKLYSTRLFLVDLKLNLLPTGLEKIHQLTKNKDMTLRVDMVDTDDNELYVQYEFVFFF